MVIVYGDKINDFTPFRFTNIHIRNNSSSTQVRKYALVIARFRERYDQYFPSFSHFADLFHEPLGE